jgi:hypothetical protein
MSEIRAEHDGVSLANEPPHLVGNLRRHLLAIFHASSAPEEVRLCHVTRSEVVHDEPRLVWREENVDRSTMRVQQRAL